MARKQTTRTKTKPVSRNNDTVETPLMQTIITALFITLFVGTLTYSLKWPVEVPLVTLGFSLLVTWFWRLRLFDGLLFAVERITQTDLTGDNQIGKPSHLIVKNAPVARSKAQSQIKESTTHTRLSALETFTKKCYSIGTSESAQGIKPNDRATYLENRDTLFRLGIADWKSSNPKSGWKMLLPEDAALEAIQAHVTQS